MHSDTPFTVFIVVSNYQRIVSDIFHVAALSPFTGAATTQISIFPGQATASTHASMDNNNNNSHMVSHDDTDPFDSSVLIPNPHFIEPDPTLVYLSFEQPNIHAQQHNHPFSVEHVNLSFTDSTFHDQSMHCNSSFTIGEELPIIYEPGSSSTRKRKNPFTDPGFEVQSMHDNNNFEAAGSSSAKKNMRPQNRRVLRNWPPLPTPIFCTCCQVLRKIYHTNGCDYARLEIHGRIAMITHAIIQKRDTAPDGPASNAYQKIDFCNTSNEAIKSFLQQYCDQKKESGYIVVDDPLSPYYEAICTKMDWVGVTRDKDDDLIPPNVGEEELEDEDEAEPDPEPEAEPGPAVLKKRKHARKDQMKRIKEITLKDLSDVFHKTVVSAALDLEMSESSIKGICRRSGLKKWPHKQLAVLARMLGVLKPSLKSHIAEVRQTTRVEIERIQQQMIDLCGGIAPTKVGMVQF